jgi:hypothetical protein
MGFSRRVGFPCILRPHYHNPHKQRWAGGSVASFRDVAQELRAIPEDPGQSRIAAAASEEPNRAYTINLDGPAAIRPGAHIVKRSGGGTGEARNLILK